MLNAVAVLVVVAPGAFVVAARGPIAAAIARGARSGIVFREAAAIETLRDADTLVVSIARPIEEGDVATLRALQATGLRLGVVDGRGRGAAGSSRRPRRRGRDRAGIPGRDRGRARAATSEEARSRDRRRGFRRGVGSGRRGNRVGVRVRSARHRAPASPWFAADLRGVLRARRLARAAVGLQKQGLLFVFGYTALAVPLAVGALRPYLGFLLDPMVAVAAAGWCSLVVLVNALRLRWQEV